MKLVQAGLLLGASTAARMVAGLVVVKVIALQLGTEGMGYLGQFMSVVALMTALAGGGTSLGLTKNIAASAGRGEDPLPHLRAAAVIWLVTSALLFVLLAGNAEALSDVLFGTTEYQSVFWGVAVAQFAMGAVNLLNAVLNGRHDVGGLAAVNSLAAVSGATVIAILVTTGGLEGAMWGLILAPCTGVLFAGVQAWRKGYLRGSRTAPRAAAEHYRQLLSYSVMLVVTVSTMPLAQIVLRRWQEQVLGWDQVGIWQGLVRLSDTWLQFATVVLANYYFPRLSALDEHPALHREVTRTFRACAAALIPAAVIIWLLREPIIQLLFSPRFLPMQELLAPQLFGDVLRTLAYVIGYLAVAKGHTVLYIAAELYQAGALLLLSHFLIPVMGARGVPYAYCATYLLYCLICITLYWRWHASQAAAT